MIEGVCILNFQNHNKTTLTFSKGVNVIFGDSDQGKSAIIRAIKWVITNRPLGDLFRKHDSNQTVAAIKKDGTVIRRRKSRKLNDYLVGNEDPHKAPKTSVPEDICAFINMSEDNIQSQHETYFLVHDSPGKRSKTLNEVAGLKIMDDTIGLTNTEIRECSSNLKAQNDSLKQTQEVIKNLSWVDSADKMLLYLEELNKNLRTLSMKKNRIKSILEDVMHLENEMEQLVPDSFVKGIHELIKTRDAISSMRKKSKHMGKIIEDILNLRKELANIPQIDVKSLKNQYISLQSMRDKRDSLQRIINTIFSEKKEHTRVLSTINSTCCEIDIYIKKLGICPTCKRRIA